MEGGGDSRGRSMPGSYTYVSEYPAQNERFGIYGVFEGKECIADFSEMGEHEICVPKPRVLVQGILRGYRGEEHESHKRIYSWSTEKRQRKRPVKYVRPTGPIYG